MSVSLFKEPSEVHISDATEFSLGTWFMDIEGQVYVIALDDRTDEKRVLCVGDFYKPFLVNIPLSEFNVHKVLQIGTLLQITATTNYGDNHGR